MKTQAHLKIGVQRFITALFRESPTPGNNRSVFQLGSRSPSWHLRTGERESTIKMDTTVTRDSTDDSQRHWLSEGSQTPMAPACVTPLLRHSGEGNLQEGRRRSGGHGLRVRKERTSAGQPALQIGGVCVSELFSLLTVAWLYCLHLSQCSDTKRSRFYRLLIEVNTCNAHFACCSEGPDWKEADQVGN